MRKNTNTFLRVHKTILKTTLYLLKEFLKDTGNSRDNIQHKEFHCNSAEISKTNIQEKKSRKVL